MRARIIYSGRFGTGARGALSRTKTGRFRCHYPLSATVLRSLDAVSSLSLHDPLLKTIRQSLRVVVRDSLVRYSVWGLLRFEGEDSLSFIFLDLSWPRERERDEGEKKEVRFVEKRINGTRTRSGNGARYVVVVALTQFLCYFPPPPLPSLLPSLSPLPHGYSVARSNEDNDDSRQLSVVR